MSNQSLLGILQVQVAGGGVDELPLYQSTIRVGRGKGNDIILDDRRVSGEHAQFSLGRDGWMVSDLDSSNKTFLNGQPLPPRRPAPLKPGDVVQIDVFSFQIRGLRPDETPPPLPLPVSLSARPTPGLVVYVGGRVLKFPLEQEIVTFGRRSSNDIRITDPQVSGYHARLERQGDTYRIVDLGSVNGLSYQGRRVPYHTFRDGDVLYIGPKIAVQYRAFIGFVPARAKKEVAAPKTQFLDMRSLPKEGRRITIGRHSSNTIVLRHPRVSRYHAVIEQFGARFRLRDLRSDNGTFVNGKRVDKEVWIKEGDVISIASFRLVFQEDGITRFDESGNIRLDAIRIEKWYTKTVGILKKVTISIYPKEFVAIVGASGAGKSTLMNTMTGFNPANGKKSVVLVNGKNLYTHMDEYRSEMGYVPQEDIIHRELTVYKALDYAAQLRMPADTTKKERHRRVMEVIRELGLEHRKNNPITALSGGQRKRVSIGVELLTKPGLFFLDEATSGLDPGTETEMMELLRDLADGGRTVILVTHATKNVMMCDQVVFLAKGGYLAFYGPPNEALEYFEQYRTPQERIYKEHIEFDDIYNLIEKRATPKEWGRRFRQSPYYKKYVVSRIQELKEQLRAPTSAPRPRLKYKRRVSAFRQFWILSARNLHIMAQDKIGLAMMLAVAPLIGIMDFMWGRKLFSPEEGNAAYIITMMFMMGLIGVLTGAISSVREIVKENDIYRRERTVVLKILPYILSKVWVGVLLALYQSVIFLIAKAVFVNPQFMGDYGYPAMYLTMFLCTLSGYMLGLLISAAAPNQNVALMLVVIVLVPQFLFAGALLPRELIKGGEQLSALTSTRWAFEGLVRITGIGEDVINDPCWQLDEQERNDLDQDDKDRMGCRCMGVQMFDKCYFPGIRNKDFYNSETQAKLQTPKPTEPAEPTPYPTFTPYPTPTPIPTPSSMAGQQGYCKKRMGQVQEYMEKQKEQGEEYQDKREEQGKEYKELMKKYAKEQREWSLNREKAVRGAEGMINGVYKQYESALRGNVEQGWLALSIISLVVFVLILVFQKRKDVI